MFQESPGFSERFSTNPFKREVPADSPAEGHAWWIPQVRAASPSISPSERLGCTRSVDVALELTDVLPVDSAAYRESVCVCVFYVSLTGFTMQPASPGGHFHRLVTHIAAHCQNKPLV